MTAVSSLRTVVTVPGISWETAGRTLLLIGLFVLMVGVVVLQFLRARELYGGSDTPPPAQQTNCSNCGARFPEGEDECPHCGEPVAGEADAEAGWESTETHSD